MRAQELAACSGLAWLVLVAACSSSAAPDAATRSAAQTSPNAAASAPLPSPPPTPPRALGAPIEFECGTWRSRLPAGATFTGSACEDDNGNEFDAATRVGVLGGQSSYEVVLERCEIFVETAGGGRPTPLPASGRTTRSALPRSRFGFARSRVMTATDGAVLIAVESSEHPEFGVRARVSPAMSESEQTRCRVVRDQLAETLANEAEWRGVLRPADGRVVLHIGSDTLHMALRLPDGFVARSTGMSADVYQSHHVIQRWPPPPMRAVDDGSFGARELDQRLMSDEGAPLDQATPRLDIVTGYAGGFTLPHAARGAPLQVGARHLRFSRVLDEATMPGCTTATELADRASGFAVTYFLCGAADPALVDVLRSVRLVRAPPRADAAER